MGSGILFYAKHNGEIYFLMGKECKNGKWSDFGGRRIGKEENLMTAVREGYEELSGFLGSMIDLRKYINNTNVELVTDTYNTYLIRIDYDKNLPYYYNNNYRFIQDKLPHIVDKDNGLFEKAQIKWMTLNFIKKNHNIFRKHYVKILINLQKLNL